MIGHICIGALLGIIQGITEFLPISSTAHLVIFENIFKVDQKVYGLSFDVFISLGTLLATIIYFRTDIGRMIRALQWPFPWEKKAPNTKLVWLILAATIPAGLAGVILENWISTSARSFSVIAFGLITVGVLMLMADRMADSAKPQSLDSHPESSILSMGIAQIFALAPGFSRSGSTIVAGVFTGLTREDAARYSFLLSLPITAAAVGKKLLEIGKDFAQNGITPDAGLFYLAGCITSAIVGYFAIHYLLGFLRRYRLSVFAYYRFFLAAILIFYR
jgi:undecaprenyl-diphosphatase